MSHAALTLPALHVSHAGIWLADGDGACREMGRSSAIAALASTPHILLNASLTGERLGHPDISGLDLLELFAFIHPASFAVPTPAGLARALGLAAPAREGDVPAALQAMAGALLDVAGQSDWPQRTGAAASLRGLSRHRWGWAAQVEQALDRTDARDGWLFSRLPEWEDAPPRPVPRTVSLAPDAILAELALRLGNNAEARPGQRDFAIAASAIFAPRRARGQPQMVLAEAGTGIGKTLGYLAPTRLWTDMSGGQVYISTYTKALQRQLARETERLYPDPALHRACVVVRKGRENYLCLLNLEDALQGGFQGRAAIFAQLVARWAAYSRDGDMVGGDLPGWLPALFRRSGLTALTDRRGECVYAGCPHYRKCFIERSQRAAEQADIVIANHALTLVQAVRRPKGSAAPLRIIFDEGHHLFDAADDGFALALTGQEAIELRRWLIGPESRSRGRRRGLAARLADVASYDAAADAAIAAILHHAEALPRDGWLKRLVAGEPVGAIEILLSAVRHQIYARADDRGQGDHGYGLETELADPDAALVAAASDAAAALDALLRPLMQLQQRLEALIEEAPDWLDGQARGRIDGARASLALRAAMLSGWLALLGRVGGPADPDFVDWLALARHDGRELDCGLHRHWLDPARPLAATVMAPAHGVLVTSATLRAGGDWAEADARAGAPHLELEPQHAAIPSPFDYRNQAEVLIVTDIKRGDLAALAGAYGRLIEAAGGGALGLFGAIKRLRIVHARIADRLARMGLPLYAQHVDPLDTGTLIDMFRDDPRASLLGTDALRDGVDVPGEALRLVIMEGVPWPRPTVLHAARRLAGGGVAFDDAAIRARLAQAFGRLIRRSSDRGQFVLLSPSVPSRLLSAFPDGTPVRRLPLDDVVQRVRAAQGKATACESQTAIADFPPP